MKAPSIIAFALCAGASLGQCALAESVTALALACSAGSAEACFSAGYDYDAGVGVQKDPAKAGEFYKKGCKLKNGSSCFNLAVLQGAQGQAGKALESYRKACDLKEAAGCTNLGSMYGSGEGTIVDQVTASAFYAKACELENGLGCANLGAMYYNGGEGLEEDLPRAARLFMKGCDLGASIGCQYLGEMYRDGEAVKQNFPLASMYLEKAKRLKQAESGKAEEPDPDADEGEDAKGQVQEGQEQ